MGPAETLFFAHPFWSWIAIGGIFLIGELVSGSGWLLWPAGAAAAVAVIARLVDPGWPIEVVLFVVIAIAATYVGRRYLPASPKGADDINDPTPRLIGREGESVETFHGGHGRVFIDGKEWAAELDGADELAARAKVRVVEIVGGARLRVRPA